ncbi:hypothetical protein Gohar_015142, partial [Gossypium harknessii]|nr:hypothetical protein [Gossypium harknessii]
VHLNALKKYTYGKHIVARVEKLVAAGVSTPCLVGVGKNVFAVVQLTEAYMRFPIFLFVWYLELSFRQ